jgi:hypothetical protein
MILVTQHARQQHTSDRQRSTHTQYLHELSIHSLGEGRGVRLQRRAQLPEGRVHSIQALYEHHLQKGEGRQLRNQEGALFLRAVHSD